MSSREVVLTGEEAAAYLMQKRAEQGTPLLAKDFIGDAAKPSKGESQQALVVEHLTKEYDMIRIRAADPVYYYRAKSSQSYTYNLFYAQDAKNLVRDTYISLGMIPTDKKVEETVKTLETMVREEEDALNNVIEITPGLYWDTGMENSLTDTPLRNCFRRLFDNTNHGGPSIIDIKLTDSLYGDEVGKEVKRTYSNTLKWLELLDGTLPPVKEYEEVAGDKNTPRLHYFPFIYTWACDNHELYMDMLKAACTIFMKNKPKKVFALTGLKRNGKSTYLSMLHTLLGRANTSGLRLAELNNYHKTEQLRFTMMNAPDEESSISDMSKDDIATFKSLAAHEPVFLDKMYSGNAMYVSSDFPCFMAWNQDPKWKGSGAAACAERTIIIPFNADLSQFDNGGKDFKKETFTPEMFTDLVGVLLALAHYYDNHDMTFSDATMAETNEVNEDTNAPIEYAKLFVKWYAGFDKQNTVFDDFAAWCTQNGYGYQGVTTKDVIFALKKTGGVPVRSSSYMKGYGRVPVQKLPMGKGSTFLAREQYIPELKQTVESCLYASNGTPSGNSVTEGLEVWLVSEQIPTVAREPQPPRDYQQEIREWREQNEQL